MPKVPNPWPIGSNAWTEPPPSDGAPLCPEIFRKRAMVEGLYGIEPPDAAQVSAFLLGLSQRLGMRPLSDPLVFSPDRHSDLHHGVAGFLPWVESGCSLYTWAPQRLFTLELYSCRDFDLQACADYACERLQARQLHSRVLYQGPAGVAPVAPPDTKEPAPGGSAGAT